MEEEKTIMLDEKGKPLVKFNKKKMWTAIVFISIGIIAMTGFIFWLGGDL